MAAGCRSDPGRVSGRTRPPSARLGVPGARDRTEAPGRPCRPRTARAGGPKRRPPNPPESSGRLWRHRPRGNYRPRPIKAAAETPAPERERERDGRDRGRDGTRP